DFNGTTLTEAGIYTDTLATVHGCDSIITLTLTEDAYQSSSIIAEICEGESYPFNGLSLTSSGSYADTVAGSGGSCDTIVTLTLTVHPIATESITATFCP